jgi:hypothetical protein
MSASVLEFLCDEFMRRRGYRSHVVKIEGRCTRVWQLIAEVSP